MPSYVRLKEWLAAYARDAASFDVAIVSLLAVPAFGCPGLVATALWVGLVTCACFRPWHPQRAQLPVALLLAPRH